MAQAVMAIALVLAGMAIFENAVAQLSNPKFPAPTGQIVDEAGLLTPADRTEILALLRELEGKSTDQVVVVTLRSLQGYDIADYGYRLGRHWGIGQAGKNNGVLLIVVPSERKTRIEVGRGLEPIMTDTMSRVIIDNALLPAFRRGDFSGGIKAAARDIKDVLLGDAEAVEQRAKGGSKRSGDSDLLPLLFILFWVAVVVLMIRAQHRHNRQLPTTLGNDPQRRDQRRRNRGGGFPNVIVIPGGSGSWGGASGGGGGWSGGGGGFGGGGSSGSW